MINKLIMDCIDMVQEWVGHEILYFNEAVEIKLTPHTPPLSIWALTVSPQGALYLMDAEEQWYPLETSDENAIHVAGTIYQRLRWMRIRYAKAS